ncbi:MAG: CARDB domain-containing protein [Caldilineaceae bacterium]
MNSNNLIFTPSAPTEGTFVTIRALVINDGNAPATNVVVQFLDVTEESSSVAIGQPQVIDTIEVGGSGIAEVIYSTAGKVGPDEHDEKRGDRKIKVVVDPNNFIAESKETDNQVSSKTLTVAAAAGPNLVMSAGNIGFNPAAPLKAIGLRFTPW